GPHRGRVCSAIFHFCYRPSRAKLPPLSLHDALPILPANELVDLALFKRSYDARRKHSAISFICIIDVTVRDESAVLRRIRRAPRSEEHTSELQSLTQSVLPLLLRKKTKTPASARAGG